MINKIKLHKIACYNNVVEIEPRKINYFFGSNGVGKSTLGKVISSPTNYPYCQLDWEKPLIEVVTYNRDFVKASFSQSNQIKGIFTLGKDATNAQTFIDEAKTKIEDLGKKILGLNNSKVTQKEKLDTKKKELEKKAWALKRKYESDFKTAFIGFMGGAESFFEKCLKEQNNSNTLLFESDIKAKCKRVFNENLKAFDPILPFTYEKLPNKENNDVLNTKIIGKDDIDIAKLIKQLDNSDWVKDGVDYLKSTENKCPFCQQGINDSLKAEIESFFDKTYETQILELDTFATNYKSYIEGLLDDIAELTKKEIPIIDFEKNSEKVNLLDEQYKNNVSKLSSKQKNPSVQISLSTLEPVLNEISKIIEGYKATVEENNKTLSNIKVEKNILTGEVWRFIVNELSVDLKTYNTVKQNVEKALNSISVSIKSYEDEKLKLEKQLKEKEADLTSVKPTVNEINKILNLWGFTNFSLDEADQKGFYKIVREDGSAVNETLSEGESTFLTFLYFYQLVKGSTTESGIGKDKILVIDDPISSLDSNVLFIVSNLTKELVRDARSNNNGIKQVFILSHNVYFFKEVTFKGSKESKSKEEVYWIIRKTNGNAHIKEHEKNLIKTTYELLWREIDEPENVNSATIFNTLRRILEYYFNILGGLNYEKAISKFEGEEQLICKSLVSWINDGSHFINDDLVVDAEPENIVKYLNVFKLIFARLGHESHYNMMIGFTNKKKEPLLVND